MKRKALCCGLLFCVVLTFFISCFSLGVCAEQTKDAETTYATIPHESTSENETFVTAFTVCFMIVLVIAAAFIMYYKR